MGYGQDDAGNSDRDAEVQKGGVTVAAQKRVPCKNCDGKGIMPAPPYKGGDCSCPICGGTGSVLVDLKTLDELGVKEELEVKVKKLREDNEALLAENMKLLRRCQEQENDLQRLEGRLEMIYLIFGWPGDMEGRTWKKL